MSEDPVPYNKQKGELKFVRLRYSLDDLVGYVTYAEECIFIDKPLRIEIETIFDEGRQILSLQEYLPQSVIELQEVELKPDEILFSTPVKAEFFEQYEYVADFFYNNNNKIKDTPKKKKLKPSEVQEKIENVVSILDAMANKKDKPVH